MVPNHATSLQNSFWYFFQNCGFGAVCMGHGQCLCMALSDSGFSLVSIVIMPCKLLSIVFVSVDLGTDNTCVTCNLLGPQHVSELLHAVTLRSFVILCSLSHTHTHTRARAHTHRHTHTHTIKYWNMTISVSCVPSTSPRASKTIKKWGRTTISLHLHSVFTLEKCFHNKQALFCSVRWYCCN
jgi:hypothetical protein